MSSPEPKHRRGPDANYSNYGTCMQAAADEVHHEVQVRVVLEGVMQADDVRVLLVRQVLQHLPGTTQHTHKRYAG